jgi:hypothetical protein
VIYFTAACRTGSLGAKNIQGTWTREKYIGSVRASRSPLSESPESVIIEDEKLTWTNYHEGSWRKIVLVEKSKSSGFYQLLVGKWEVESPDVELAEMPFTPMKDRHGKVEALIFHDDSIIAHVEERFVRIPVPLEQWVAQIVLVGSYADEEGNNYRFDESGVAHWPGRSFTYEVVVDSFMASCDYFLVDHDKNPVNTRTIGFKWSGGKLELFETKDEEECLVCEERPFVVLTPIVRD